MSAGLSFGLGVVSGMLVVVAALNAALRAITTIPLTTMPRETRPRERLTATTTQTTEETR